MFPMTLMLTGFYASILQHEFLMSFFYRENDTAEVNHFYFDSSSCSTITICLNATFFGMRHST